MTHRRLDRIVWWLLVAWVLQIASGASTTGLVRAPLGVAALGPAMLTTHMVIGVALGVCIPGYLAMTRHRRRLWAVTMTVAAAAAGWYASRTFAALPVAAHAALAAFAGVGLAAAATDAAFQDGPRARSAGSWKTSVARLGLALTLLQVALGALLRHQLIGLTWHLLVAGLVALATLVVGVSVTQDEAMSVRARAAARWAITSVLVQISLGAAVLFLIFTSTTNVPLWLAVTVAHVVMATLTVLAVATLTRALTGELPAKDPDAERTVR